MKWFHGWRLAAMVLAAVICIGMVSADASKPDPSLAKRLQQARAGEPMGDQTEPAQLPAPAPNAPATPGLARETHPHH